MPDKVGQLCGRQAVASRLLGRGDGLLDFEQQGGQFAGPRLLVTLLDEAQIAQVMDITGGMAEMGIGEVGGVIIMDDGCRAVGENAAVRMRFATTIGTHAEVSQEGCTRYMHPLELVGDACAGSSGRNRRGRLNEGVADRLHHQFQGLRHPCTRRHDGRRTHRLPI